MLLFNPFPPLIYSDVEHYNSQSSSNFPSIGGLFDVIHYVTSALLVLVDKWAVIDRIVAHGIRTPDHPHAMRTLV